ncbi:MAG: uroporphyrinogen decarboxylase family protein [Bryobacteraceae bacterium]
MDRQFYLDLAARGLRMPIGTDLVLHEQTDPEAIMRDPERLGRVMESAAARYHTPLAFPLMDLRLEKADILGRLGVPESEVDTYHFHEPPPPVPDSTDESAFTIRARAHFGSIRYIANCTDLVPVGMCIGPFSLMTKLMADPITAVAMAGSGMTSDDDPDVLMAERCLEAAEAAVSRSMAAQARAGARALIVCEPAANIVYLSPKQIDAGSDIFERFVMQPNLRLRAQLAGDGVDLIFHDCGELSPSLVRQFAERLDPVILSLGSSRKLWEDAAVVPKRVVLFGNLPTKSFYSDSVMPAEKVAQFTLDLESRMKAAGHPHILGSECDVLHVPDAAETIRRKVDVMLTS